ncbi:hypothetical protein [Duncaniella sp.]|uniref:hypothetical protein n=1 Tax=Duncaniella sp. TaxID=2518496 RepID=UPI0023CDEDD2|nr:hypothetical protein [Duncaniella sp.]MDE5905500.1 hypothetical protein [Duncaniella sp.]
MKKYLLSSAMLAATLSLTSCLGSSSGDEQTWTYNYGGDVCFNRVIDLQNGSEFIASSPSYNLKYTPADAQVEITLSNILLSQGASPLSFKFPTMKYTQDALDGFIVTTGRSIVPENAAGNSPYVFDSFTLRTYFGRPNYLGSVYYIRYQLDINNEPRYEVTTYSKRNAYIGPVTATDLEDNSVYTTANNIDAQADTYYLVILDQEKRTATLQVYNGKYSDSMTPLVFMVKDLPYTYTDYGYTIVAGTDNVLPVYTATSGEKPAEGLEMTDLSIVGNLQNGATIRFKCNLGDNDKYNVTANLRYLLYNTNKE